MTPANDNPSPKVSPYLNLAPRTLALAAGDYVRGSRDMGETIARLALVARVQSHG